MASSYRTSLPCSMAKTQDMGIWSFLKGCIGKELTKVTMPIEFNEPLSFLQRLCEYMEYSDLLDKADSFTDPAKRMEYVTAFAVSALAGNADRIHKPFNPLLGETYELVRQDFRFVVEQVSHHPPVSAFHAESEHFQFWGAIHPRVKFWGKSLEVKPEGRFTIKLKKLGDIYTWRNVNCFVHNILVGKLWFEQIGVMEIVGETTGYKVILNFRPSESSIKDRHCVDGFLYDNKKEKTRYLYGKWTECLQSLSLQEYLQASPSKQHKASRLAHLTRTLTGGGPSTSGNGSKSPGEQDNSIPDNCLSNNHNLGPFAAKGDVLWKVTAKPDNSPLYYNFTLFAMSLNELKEDMKDILPCTDSRLRPDLRLYEEGKKDQAKMEKERLEQKQRESRIERTARKKEKDPWTPLWFTTDTDMEWKFTGEYWKREFARCPNIF